MSLGNVHLTPQLVQAVRDAVDILEVAAEGTRLVKKGKRYVGLCPFHKEKTPSFSVDPVQGLFYCFGCGAGGDAIKLFMQQTGDDFPAAIEALARRHGIPLPRAPQGGGRRDQAPGLAPALEAAASFFRQELDKSSLARRYLESRRIPEELSERYGLGYAPEGWRNLIAALEGRIAVADLEAAGLATRGDKGDRPYDRFRNRLMFPITAPNGRLVGFGGRTLGDDTAKYVNSAESEQFHKGRLLYGFHQAKRALRDRGWALLVEGYFDVLGAVAAGLDGAVAPMGTALTEEQARLLGRYVDEVVVAFDGDAAGEKAFQRALPILLGAGLAVRRAAFPAGHDPDSLRLAEGPQAVVEAAAAAEDGVWHEIRRLVPPEKDRSPAEQTRAAGAILELLKPIRDPILRSGYTRRAAEHLGVPEALLASRLGRQLYTPAAPAAGAVEVRSTEEKAIALMLRGVAPLPPLDGLPPPEAFFDETCRNIYAVFCDLYSVGGGVPPAASVVLSRLSGEGSAIDRVARLLLEGSDADEEDLVGTLETLQRRWQKRRLPELMRQIRQALEGGDQDLLGRLLEEKTALIRCLHPDTTGNVW